jgi:methylenetetrahydrofolate reductase (NADPH)
MPAPPPHQAAFSFELFPPKTPEGMTKLATSIDLLNAVGPEYFSVTYGAGGSTRESTFATLDLLLARGIPAAPHLACIGSSRAEIRGILEHYQAQGIRRLVALRGDLPSGMGLGTAGDFRNANELVAFIRQETGDHFYGLRSPPTPRSIPRPPTPIRTWPTFQRKVEAGANAAITQYFYNPDAYFGFVERCAARGIDIPIQPGIMPITNFSQLARFSDACGAEIPRWVRKRLEALGDDIEAIRAFGHEVVLGLCSRLLEGGAPGLHFYSMNQAGPVLRVCQDLGLTPVGRP